MRLIIIGLLFLALGCGTQPTKSNPSIAPASTKITEQLPEGWESLFGASLEKAEYPQGIWYIEDGALTATEDQHIWTKTDYDNFELDLEFKTAKGTNSGVIVYCSDVGDWIPNSVEVQIADDYHRKWAKADPSWRCGAIFGHQPASKPGIVNKPGNWNRYQITCVDKQISVVLNGELINEFNMAEYTSAQTNPDGTEVPSWLSKPKSTLPTMGRIGLQGKHAGAPVWFRNLRVRPL